MKTVIEMAKEAGFMDVAKGENGTMWFECFPEEIERFAELVRADEREECAKVCDALHYEVDAYGAQCAAAIRARGQQCPHCHGLGYDASGYGCTCATPR